MHSGDASQKGTEESVGGCLCSGLAATYLELCTDGQLILDDAIADRACAAAALRCLLAFSQDAKVSNPMPSLWRQKQFMSPSTTVSYKVNLTHVCTLTESTISPSVLILVPWMYVLVLVSYLCSGEGLPTLGIFEPHQPLP